MVDYEISINNGNENIGFEGKTITVNEKVKPAEQSFLADQISLRNRLVPSEIAEQCIMTLCDVICNLSAQGFSILIRNKKGDTYLRFSPDIKINTSNGNLTLAKAKELMPGIEDITLQNARELVSRAGLTTKISVEVTKKLTEQFNKEDFSLNCVGVVERDKIIKKDSSTGTTVDTSTGTVDTSTGSNSGGGDDIPAGNG